MSKRKSPRLTDLGNGLAIEAMQTLNMNKFVLTACMSLSNPESIHNFARFADVLEKAHQKGVDSVLKPMGEKELTQHALAKQAADMLVMQASLLKTENEKLKKSLADMTCIIEGQKPVARLQISDRQDTESGIVYYDIVVLDRARCSDDMELFASPLAMSDLTTKVREDAKRWNELLHHVGAESSGAMMYGEFVIRRSVEEMKTHNLMKGGVSGHLTDYIDRMIVQRKG